MYCIMVTVQYSMEHVCYTVVWTSILDNEKFLVVCGKIWHVSSHENLYIFRSKSVISLLYNYNIHVFLFGSHQIPYFILIWLQSTLFQICSTTGTSIVVGSSMVCVKLPNSSFYTWISCYVKTNCLYLYSRRQRDVLNQSDSMLSGIETRSTPSSPPTNTQSTHTQYSFHNLPCAKYNPPQELISS